MRITARRAKRVWIVTRCLFVIIPLSQAIIAGFGLRDLMCALVWFVMAVVVATMIMMERNAFHHGFHFGQIMIMWCISHDITPEEFAVMPEPEPWDLPWTTKITESDDDGDHVGG